MKKYLNGFAGVGIAALLALASNRAVAANACYQRIEPIQTKHGLLIPADQICLETMKVHFSFAPFQMAKTILTLQDVVYPGQYDVSLLGTITESGKKVYRVESVLASSNYSEGSCSEQESVQLRVRYRIDGDGSVLAIDQVAAVHRYTYDGCHDSPRFTEYVYGQ
jgi:hypothetical protein